MENVKRTTDDWSTEPIDWFFIVGFSFLIVSHHP